MAQRITGEIPQPGGETVSVQPAPGATKTTTGRREGFVQRQVNKIKRFRRERAARKKAEAAAAAKKQAEGQAKAKEKGVSLRKTESQIEKRRRRQREELHGTSK